MFTGVVPCLSASGYAKTKGVYSWFYETKQTTINGHSTILISLTRASSQT